MALIEMNQQPTIGEKFGTGLAQGLVGSLDNLVQNKLAQLQQKQQYDLKEQFARRGATNYASLLGVSPQDAYSMLLSPEHVQKAIIENLAERRGRQDLMDMLNPGQQQMAQYSPDGMQQQIGMPQGEANIPQGQGFGGGQQGIPQGRQPLISKPISEHALLAQAKMKQADRFNAQKMGLAQRKLAQTDRVLEQKDLSREQKERLFNKKLDYEDEIYRRDAAQKPLKELIDSKKAGEETKIRTGKILKLIDSGKLTSAAWANFWSYLGFEDTSALLNPASNEFEKLSMDFVKNAKQIFGSRVTNQDLIAFMKTVPTLMQTDEGKRRIISNMNMFADAAIKRYEVAQQLLSENNGIPPHNFELEVDKRFKPFQDKFANDFVNNTGIRLYEQGATKTLNNGQKMIFINGEWYEDDQQ